ncbi:PIN domain-containing protein [Georgenia yuyongxinii]|uniref:Ribonuclease VapC n=1 Tax=Georgenia yuyongxinii TaxID=2589797 RepID=A0A552WTY4_9MICO|nr:PIN domain-containing protein [Georgenia yuyongxinii]TRW46234.1 PIN domain nuclease [Georgenia yuyongxinii]
MTTHLIDTSVLIEWLRDTSSRATAELERLRDAAGDLALTQPVVMEVLMGAPRGTELRTRRALARFPLLDVDLSDFEVAADLYRGAMQSGNTVRSSMDCVIAAVALRSGAVLVHRDRDFRRLAAIAPDLHCLDTLDEPVA